MAEYCTKCLVKVMKYTPEEAKKENRIYKKGEKDLCEGCGKVVVMRNLEGKK